VPATILPRVLFTTHTWARTASLAALRVRLLLALAAVCCAQVAGAAAPDGAALFKADCAACHGSDGRGRSAAEVGFDLPLPNFTDCTFTTPEPDSDWSSIIHRGGPARGFDRMMPAFGETLTEDEIEALIRHLRSFCKNPRWPRGELNMPRALFTEKAFPEDEAVITTSLTTEGPDSLSHLFAWEQRFGIGNQIELAIPIARADLGSQGWKSGTGDMTIGVKHVLHHDLERGSILAFGGEVTLPTGDEAKGFGEGTTLLESFVLWDKLLPHDAFMQMQGIFEAPRDSARDSEAQIRVAFGRTWTADAPFGRGWTPMIEAIGVKPLTAGAKTEWDLVPQLQVTLSRRQHIQAGAGFRMPANDRANRTGSFVFFLLWDWADGRLREGW
jgi:mono/diheme cytochrome c family protein